MGEMHSISFEMCPIPAAEPLFPVHANEGAADAQSKQATPASVMSSNLAMLSPHLNFNFHSAKKVPAVIVACSLQ